ncbi:MAG TPA: SusC/RagA family TonB-linked outer membrane protein [Chitinophagaceae bacterium]|nr:SusC/RagA family TonB-linked outer membrane protein [Chitinophagaceae bacterium]
MQKAFLCAGSAVVQTVRKLSKRTVYNRQLFIKGVLIMKLVLLLTAVLCLQASATGYAQTINLSLKDAKLEKVFKEIEKQSNYRFIYTREQLEKTNNVTVAVKNASISTVLDICFKEQPLLFFLEENYIVIKTKDGNKRSDLLPVSNLKSISGIVTDESGEAIPAATVSIKGTTIATACNAYGEWKLDYEGEYTTLVVSSIGYGSKEVLIPARNYFRVVLGKLVNSLDETIVIAYGKTTQRLNTGSVSKVTASEISKQPVSNVLAALEGRVPGLIITQTSGVPGSSFKVEIRGRSSLDLSLSRNDPLFIIDGVPFEPGNLPTNQLITAANQPGNTALGGLSAFNSINPDDIESVEVLKDADATSIYGSRGANGVILITTKKGRAGKTTLSIHLSAGWSKVTRTMDMLTTDQYVVMRREAISNDGFIPNVTAPFGNGYAPDLLIWDTTHYVNYKKLILGNTAFSTDANVSLSGGNGQTQFLMSSGFHRETNVFSNDLSDKMASLHFNFYHSTTDKKLSINFSGFYSNDNNQLIQKDLTQYINLPPNFSAYDSAGNPNWIQNGIPISNVGLGYSTVPAAELLKKYTSVNDNLLGNFLINYTIARNLIIRSSFGYNRFTTDEVSIIPKTSLSPTSNELASSNFGNGTSRSWIIEPRAEYNASIGKGKIQILAGATWQERTTKSESTNAINYSSDLLLYSIAAAGSTTARNNYSEYRYNALYSRLNYNWRDKYIINLSGRRDGSSRFGPGKRYANFGAIGAAWIFSNEQFIKEEISFLSFGKLRGSYGTAGNDQIGDYKYLDLWNSTPRGYQGMPGLAPASLFNPNYEWEVNKKFEAAIELGFLKDRILFAGAFYNNRSSNQLINYRLPNQTGSETIVKNFPAVVENSGIELSGSAKIVFSKDFEWTSTLHITLPKNELVSFPGLEGSSYALAYEEGKSLSIIKLWKYTGVDPAKGIYTVADVNGDGQFNDADYVVSGNADPEFYGGSQQAIRYKGIELSLFFDYRKQTGKNYLAAVANNHPGLAVNQPEVVLDRWTKPGDIASIQKYTSTYGGPAAFGVYYLTLSDGIYSDASFIRLKNLSINYRLPDKWLRKVHIENGRVFVQGQNLFVITDYVGSDPETQNILVQPPLKTISAGLQFNF